MNLVRRSQGSIEYLILLGITIVIIFIVVGYVATYTHSEASIANRTAGNVMSNVKEGILNITSEETKG
ncbi:hypothetical protein QDY65_03385 [Pyrococcus kukulkanii]|uniref:hypothetical protein n=1 Tax=Pyrococcus kukulkanii TaxID=1609559 RepID=UPI001D105761|nr:hypothetical protein [Pyrococcus kukulkanii]